MHEHNSEVFSARFACAFFLFFFFDLISLRVTMVLTWLLLQQQR